MLSKFKKRCNTYAARFRGALNFNILFRGTTRFQSPAKIQGKELCLPSDQKGIHLDFIDVILDDDYGVKCFDNPKLVVDVGGNAGLFSIWVALNWPQSEIKSYEPDPQIFSFLQQNSKAFGFQANNAGVGKSSGRAELLLNNESRLNTMDFSGSPSRDSCTSVSVKILSLTEILGENKYIDVLKLDCEGSEWEIFEDVSVFKKVKKIVMEYHLIEDKSLSQLMEVTGALGFRCVHLSKNEGFGIAWFERALTL